MTRNIPAFRKHRLALAAAVVLLAVALTAGSMFAANERLNPDLLPSSGQLPIDGTDPGLAAEPPAPAAMKAELPKAEPLENEANPGVNQVISDSDGSDALAEWLADQPEEMGPFTVAEAMSADSETVDWLLYQAVYKDVMTQEEADIFQAWYDRRPSSREAPELLNHQPAYLDRSHDPDSIREMFRETETR